MPMAARGIPKLIEECGELQQVLGKRLAYWHTDEHPDGTNLIERMVEEMGDVMGAIRFSAEYFGIAMQVSERARQKYGQFLEWDLLPDNNNDSVENRRE